MYTFLLLIFIVVCVALTMVILLQSSKGGGLAGAFGGAGDMGAVFGGRGAASFLSKMTTILAIAFLSLSLLLSLINRGGSGSQGLIEQQQQQQAAPSPGANLPMVPTEDSQQMLPMEQEQTPPDTGQ